MSKSKKLFLLLVCFISAFSLIMLTSCETKPVGAISPDVEPTTEIIPSISGQIVGSKTNLGISGVSVSIAANSTTTDSEGYFQFLDLPSGNYTFTFEKEGYNTIVKQYTIPDEATTVYVEYKMIKFSEPIDVTPEAGGQLNEGTDDGPVKGNIPPGAVSENVKVAITSTLGSGTQLDIASLIQSNEAPVGSNTITPLDQVFNQPVEMESPQTMPAQYITGNIEVVRINPQTGQPEVVGTANIVNGKIVYNIDKGGEYLLRVKTSLVHKVTQSSVVNVLGSYKPNDTPGTYKTLEFHNDATVESDEGFSQDMIETIFGYSGSSNTTTFGLTKPSGANTSITAVLPATQETQTYSTPGGMILAKVSALGNQGTSNVWIAQRLYRRRCVQISETHGDWVSYFEKKVPSDPNNPSSPMEWVAATNPTIIGQLQAHFTTPCPD